MPRGARGQKYYIVMYVKYYVPRNIVFSHMTRQQVAAKSFIVADCIPGDPDVPTRQNPAITIADATYLHTQKSSNYLFSKGYIFP